MRRLCTSLLSVGLVSGLFAMSAAGAGPEAPENVSGDAVPNYKRLTPMLATAGQPTPEALGRLRSLGFRTVINLRTESEPGVQAEAELLRAAGINYVSVPVTPETLGASQVDAVRRVLDDPASGPVLLHCGSSNRVGAVWALLQARAKGLNAEQAIEEGRRAGLSSAGMVDAVKRALAAPGSAPQTKQ